MGRDFGEGVEVMDSRTCIFGVAMLVDKATTFNSLDNAGQHKIIKVLHVVKRDARRYILGNVVQIEKEFRPLGCHNVLEVGRPDAPFRLIGQVLEGLDVRFKLKTDVIRRRCVR